MPQHPNMCVPEPSRSRRFDKRKCDHLQTSKHTTALYGRPIATSGRERLALHSAKIPECPSSVHDLKFWPKDKSAKLVMRKAASEANAAATPAAWAGGRRKFRDADMQFDFGTKVRKVACEHAHLLEQQLPRICRTWHAASPAGQLAAAYVKH